MAVAIKLLDPEEADLSLSTSCLICLDTSLLISGSVPKSSDKS